MMRASIAKRDDRSLQERLGELDAQLRSFEASLRAHQHNHSRLRELEVDLAEVLEQAASVVHDLSAIRDEVRRAAESVARDAATPAANHLKTFEERGARLLDAYAEAVRAAQQAVARAEARIEAIDQRIARELVPADKESRVGRRLGPALAAAALLILGVAGYLLMTRSVREASGRAATAEREAADVRREANERIASVERKLAQVSDDMLTRAAHAERMASILAARDARRMPMRGYGKARGASGEALWNSSRGLVITGSGLPVLSDREVYQVWFVSATGSVSLGVLTPDRSGHLTGVFDLPGTLSPTGFMITREVAGGAKRPSAAVVLAT